MRALNKSTYKVILLFISLVILAAQCQESEPLANQQPTGYLNWGDSAQYVGIQVCAQCHEDQHKTFVHTGMGLSFDTVTKTKSAAVHLGRQILIDSATGFRYRPYWSGDSLLIEEFMENGYVRSQHVNYIVGSGQHTNSHIYSENGYLYQAPFTFYTQSALLDFPPGFESGNNSRFSRPIGLECMSCHNAMPTGFVEGSENKYDLIPKGIDCERCHGPGSLHVQKLQRGGAVDTSKDVDWTIVNPKRLSPELQFELCQRCHLQGNTVLHEGKSFFDFKPGMRLDSIMSVFLPRYENSDKQFIMASHADRFKLSKCFEAGKGDFNCNSCHNPHLSVRETNLEKFNKSCESCHGGLDKNFGCMKTIKSLNLDQFNCVKCHMPSSGSIDIPHVTVHDHYIRVVSKAETPKKEKGKFLGLQSVNNPNPRNQIKIHAYLQQFERFDQNPIFLDSAQRFLQIEQVENVWQEWVQYYYLRNEKTLLVKFVEENGRSNSWLERLLNSSFDNKHAWTAYRIAEAYKSFGDYNTALKFAKRAVELAPHHPEFRIKQGSIYALLENYVLAEKCFLEVNDQNSLIAENWSDLGFVQLAQRKHIDAEKSLTKALALDPNYTMAKLNLASVYLAGERFKEARKLLEEIIEEEPGNMRVQSALDYLNKENL